MRDREDILIADTPQDFAQAVVKVIWDRELAQRLVENERRWAGRRGATGEWSTKS